MEKTEEQGEGDSVATVTLIGMIVAIDAGALYRDLRAMICSSRGASGERAGSRGGGGDKL